MNYYNEFDPCAAEWLRMLIREEVIPPGDVDGRSIVDVSPTDLTGYTQCHFFSGIGGWPIALRLAGWPDDRRVWTGSCPCQPYSAAGKQEGNADERNLWPDFYRLIRKCRPDVIFGEQVANAIGHGWLDGICADLEGEDYACGPVVLPACSVGSPILRQRIWWVAVSLAGSDINGRTGSGSRISGRVEKTERCESVIDTGHDGVASGPVAGTASPSGPKQRRESRAEVRREAGPQDATEHTGPLGSLGSTGKPGSQGLAGHGNRGDQPRRDDAGPQRSTAASGAWDQFGVVHCRDGKARRISAERGDEPLAHGIPASSRPLLAVLEGMGLDRGAVKRCQRAANRILAAARRNRVGRLKGYGNAIVPQVAAKFVESFLEIEGVVK